MSRLAPPPPQTNATQAAIKPLVVGIGCRRGATVNQIDAAVRAALGARSICEVGRVATIASKADEPALLEFCDGYGLPLVTFSSGMITACLDANAALARSPNVHERVGVGGVCEPCALLATPGGMLITAKQVLDGVTVAIAAAAGHASPAGNDADLPPDPDAGANPDANR
ncbi:MAG TPA: cobalamin biosynthesis protein [Trinickia sp.]|uniref:cobalamin biosynthesis protein n=1 Tax=Trinickia sp. TaxID=2571163 RepID=UPI002BEA5B0A|nr:cobalamin biosynthesis protein [Trinickia sp.]HTI17163.1 cobalamin biosynthesis protein [Trinickia sp.]